MSRLHFAITATWLVCCLTNWLPSLRGQPAPPEDWEAALIYIPEAEQSQSIPPDYWPIELPELKQQLDRARQLRRQAQLDAISLDEAIYVASITRELLTSENSRWKFRGSADGQPLPVGKMNVALRDARSLPNDQRQLAEVQRFDERGNVEVLLDGTATSFWFGFQSAAMPADRQHRFELELPPAPLAKLFISAEASLHLSSETVVVERIEEPAPYLPSDWPLETPAPRTAASASAVRPHWWLIHLSGVSRFDLQVDFIPDGKSVRFQHIVKLAQSQYIIDDAAVNATAQFELATESSGQPMRIELEPTWRLRTVRLDGQLARWHTESLMEDFHTIRIDDAFARAGMLVEVQATSNLDGLILEPAGQAAGDLVKGLDQSADYTRRVRLPRIDLADGFTLSGITRIEGAEGQIVSRVESSRSFRPENLGAATTEPSLSDGIAWATSWLGQPPPVVAEVTRRRATWDSSSLTRLSPQTGYVSAISRIRLTGRNLHSNQLRLPVLGGWLIDDARLLADSADDLRIDVEVLPSGVTELVLHWQPQLGSMDARIEISAHWVFDAQASQVSLDSPRLVQLPAGVHPAYYLVEGSSGYRVRFDARLLQMTVPKRELEPWQQQLVPESGPVLYKELAQSRDLFVLESVVGSVAVQTVTTLHPRDAGDWQSTTHIFGDSQGSRVDRLRVALPEAQDLSRWQFVLVRDDGGSIDLSPVAAERIQVGETREYELIFPTAITGSFHIRASSLLSLDDQAAAGRLLLTTVGLPTASSVEAAIIVPRSLANFADLTPLELLPAGSCCHPWMSDALLKQLEIDPHHDLVARVDGNTSQRFALAESSTAAPGLWIWREQIEHFIPDSGPRIHRVTAAVHTENDDGGRLAIRVPSSWRLRRLLLDTAVTTHDDSQAGLLIIPIGPGRRHQLLMEFHAPHDDLRWLNQLTIDQPQFEVPVFERRQIVHLAPSGWLVDPSQSWRAWLPLLAAAKSYFWLGVHKWAASTADQPAPADSNWTHRELTLRQESGPTPRTLWIINRSAASSAYLAMILVLGAVGWRLLRWRPWCWWLLLMASLSVAWLLPESLAPVGASLLNALGLGAVARLIELIGTRPASEPRGIKPARLGTASTALAVLAGLGSTAVGQQTSFGEAPSKPGAQRLYGVFIPSVEGDQPAGDYAYIPKELKELLAQHRSITAAPAPPRILSANYTIRMRQNLRDTDPVQEFTADLRIAVTATDVELLLPFRADQLRLVSAPLLNGQPRMLNVRDFRLPTDGSGVLFRPDSTGIMNVTLQFKPVMGESSDRQFRWQASIPPVPNAMLRIGANIQAANYTVNARGGTQRSFLGDTIAYLGPIDRLELAWTERERNLGPAAAEQTCDTWVHAHGQHLVAACQVTIERSKGLAGEVDLFVDPDWEPVGTRWGDAELVGMAQFSSLRRRTVLRVRLSSDDNQNSIIRMILVPKSLTGQSTLEAPTVALDRVTAKGKYFWWSTDASANWLPEGFENQSVRAGNVNAWGRLALAPENSGFQVFGGSVKLRRQESSAASPEFSEANALHLNAGTTVLTYDANWETTGKQPDFLLLRLPDQARIRRFEINGNSIKYRLEANDRTLLVALNEGIGDRLRRLRVNLELPALDGHLEELPRVTVAGHVPRQSTYQLFRSAGIEVRLHSSGSGLEFLAGFGDNRRLQSLETLEVFVGEANLPAEFLAESRLPVAIDIAPALQADHESCVMYVDRAADGWLATVRCNWGQATPNVDFGFFDIPLSLRDTLISRQVPCSFMPHADPTRTNLCLPVSRGADASAGGSLTFSFPLTSAQSSQSLTIPRIIARHGRPERPTLALPTQIDNQAVRWIKAGRELGTAWHGQSSVPEDSRYSFYSLPRHQTQVAWQPLEQIRQKSRSALTWVELAGISPPKATGVVHYWIDPRGQLTQQLELPEGCEVLGVDCGTRPAVWSLSDRVLRVTLQPNYLPLPLRVMLAWHIEPSETLQLTIPRALADSPPGPVLLSIADSDDWQVVDLTQPTDADYRPQLINTWAGLVLSQATTLATVGASEAEQWLQAWHPASIGFAMNWPLNTSSLQASAETFDLNDDGEITVGELWTQIELAAHEANWVEADLQSPSESPLAETLWSVAGDTITLELVGDDPPQQPRWAIAGLALAVGISGLLLGRRLAAWYGRWSLANPWLHWVWLAVVLGAMLPLIWPAAISLLVAGWLAATGVWSARQRRHRRFA